MSCLLWLWLPYPFKFGCHAGFNVSSHLASVITSSLPLIVAWNWFGKNNSADVDFRFHDRELFYIHGPAAKSRSLEVLTWWREFTVPYIRGTVPRSWSTKGCGSRPGESTTRQTYLRQGDLGLKRWYRTSPQTKRCSFLYVQFMMVYMLITEDFTFELY